MNNRFDRKALFLLSKRDFILKPNEANFLKHVKTGVALTVPQINMFNDIQTRYLQSRMQKIRSFVQEVEKYLAIDTENGDFEAKTEP